MLIKPGNKCLDKNLWFVLHPTRGSNEGVQSDRWMLPLLLMLETNVLPGFSESILAQALPKIGDQALRCSFWNLHSHFSPGPSLLHPHLLPISLLKIFFQAFVSPALIAPSQIWVCVSWQWLLLVLFPPSQLPGNGNGDGPKAVQAHQRALTPPWESLLNAEDIQAACKYIQMAEESKHRISFSISISNLPPTTLWLFSGWIQLMWVTQG